jgi:hypothetical protein
MHAVGKLLLKFVRNSLLDDILIGKAATIRQSFISRHKNELKRG